MKNLWNWVTQIKDAFLAMIEIALLYLIGFIILLVVTPIQIFLQLDRQTIVKLMRVKTLKTFGKYTVVWISQNLAIPFWIVGHIHLSIHSFHDLYELLASVGMNIIVLIGFIIDYKDVTKQIKEKS